jgi:aryl-alcohol dehydrogenase-like predicted oxidoreductase
MSEFYGQADESESLATLHRALELGLNFLDTADVYGPHTNEELVGRFLQGRREQVVLASKCGIVRDPSNPMARGLNGRPEYVKACCDASLKRLQIDVIDLYYLHRVDPNTPIEETVGAMAELVEAGKIRHIGLSEANPETLRRAHRTHPITALQSEYSLWTRDPEAEVLATCRELNIGFVPYSPLGRGFLTGQLQRFEDFAPDDYRRNSPRFQGENFAKKSRDSGAASRDCRTKRLHSIPTGPGLGSGSGRPSGANSRDQETPIPGRKPGSRRIRAKPRRIELYRPGLPQRRSRGRPLSRSDAQTARPESLTSRASSPTTSLLLPADPCVE